MPTTMSASPISFRRVRSSLERLFWPFSFIESSSHHRVDLDLNNKAFPPVWLCLQLGTDLHTTTIFPHCEKLLARRSHIVRAGMLNVDVMLGDHVGTSARPPRKPCGFCPWSWRSFTPRGSESTAANARGARVSPGGAGAPAHACCPKETNLQFFQSSPLLRGTFGCGCLIHTDLAAIFERGLSNAAASSAKMPSKATSIRRHSGIRGEPKG